MYLRGLLNCIGIETDQVTIFNDNQGAIELVTNKAFHPRSKHIALKYHKIRDESEKGNIDVKYLCSERMPADILTKT